MKDVLYQVDSWSKPNIDNIIARKRVDLSLFKYGIHIPIEYRKSFLSIIPEGYISLGKAKKIIMEFDDFSAEAEIRNINVQKRNDDVLQIRYGVNSDIAKYLKSKFKKSYYILEANSSQDQDNINEYIEFYKSDKPYKLNVKLITESEDTMSIKEKFFNYIGDKNSLGNNYQKSYKLILLIKLLNNVNAEGKGDYEKICNDIANFYIKRHSDGLLVESSDSKIAQKINSLSVDIVKSIMNENAYKVINNQGYVYKEQIDDQEYLCFNKELWNSLNKEDISNLNSILYSKLELYYKERINDSNDNKEEDLIIKDAVEQIHNYILAKGYTYDLDLIKNYYLSLKTKPFVLLSGISGTGKSKLVQLFAEAIGSTCENGRFMLIPVRPDWSDPSDLLGYKNIDNKFLQGPLTTIITRAIDDPTNPYFVCLDEMNLARVEYYFSDVLSLMETRKKIGEKIVTEKFFKIETFGEDKEAAKKYGDLYIPENLYIVGTVNMDETTFPFSKKVLDRANTIEFNEVNLNINFEYFDTIVEDIKGLKMNNSYISSKYLKVIDCINKREEIEKIISILNEINYELEKINHHFGYRVRDEVIFYVLYAIEDELMNMDEALDHAIRQKILPRIQGSNISIKEVLINLYKLFSNDFSSDLDVYDNSVSERILEYIKANKVKYPFSIKKVYRMIRRFDLDGFTTFWE